MFRWPQIKDDFETSSRRIRLRSARLKEKADALASVAAASRPAAKLQAIDAYGPIQNESAPLPNDPNTMASLFPCHNLPSERSDQFRARIAELKAIKNALVPSLV